jgi:hypothetical protein
LVGGKKDTKNAASHGLQPVPRGAEVYVTTTGNEVVLKNATGRRLLVGSGPCEAGASW